MLFANRRKREREMQNDKNRDSVDFLEFTFIATTKNI